MRKIIFVTVFIYSMLGFQARAQDELIFLEKQEISNYDLKITRVSADTLFYRAFFRNRYCLMIDLMAYRYKDHAWIFTNESYKSLIQVQKVREEYIKNERGRKGELFLLDGGETDYALTILRITKDTLFYNEFMRDKFILMSQLVGYRYLKQKWIYVDHAYKENMIALRDTTSPAFKLRKKLILTHARTKNRINKLNSVNNYSVYFGGQYLELKSLKLEKDCYVAVRLKSDTLGSVFVLPLIKIVKDSLYFDTNYFGWESYIGISLNELSYINFDPLFPSPLLPLTERKKLESSIKLLGATYRSKRGIWLEDESVKYTSVDIGY